MITIWPLPNPRWSRDSYSWRPIYSDHDLCVFWGDLTWYNVCRLKNNPVCKWRELGMIKWLEGFENSFEKRHTYVRKSPCVYSPVPFTAHAYPIRGQGAVANESTNVPPWDNFVFMHNLWGANFWRQRHELTDETPPRGCMNKCE